MVDALHRALEVLRCQCERECDGVVLRTVTPLENAGEMVSPETASWLLPYFGMAALFIALGFRR